MSNQDNRSNAKRGYAYLGIAGAKQITPEQIAEGAKRVRQELFPEIRLQVRKKEEGAEAIRTLKLF